MPLVCNGSQPSASTQGPYRARHFLQPSCQCDNQRRRLAAKGKRTGRRLLVQVATIVTPDTILRWHRRLIAANLDVPRIPSTMGRRLVDG